MAIIQYSAITTSQKEGNLGDIIPNFRPKHGNLLQVKKISEFFQLFFQKQLFSFDKSLFFPGIVQKIS